MNVYKLIGQRPRGWDIETQHPSALVAPAYMWKTTWPHYYQVDRDGKRVNTDCGNLVHIRIMHTRIHESPYKKKRNL
jgi:hypothetical protein